MAVEQIREQLKQKGLKVLKNGILLILIKPEKLGKNIIFLIKMK